MIGKAEFAYSLPYLRFSITYANGLHLDEHNSRLQDGRTKIMSTKEFNLDGEKV